MKKIATLILISFLYQIVFAQSKMVEGIISQIELQSDTIKSVYDWIVNNIEYDVGKLNDIKEGDTSPPKKSTESQEQLLELQLERVISRRKGVCEDYSVLFDAIISELGYKSYIIVGYTKNEQGMVGRRIGHTWNSVKVDGSWKLYDPTWGAGYIEDNKKFIKLYNEQWYNIDPKEMINTHMPYDPIWQLSNNPISYKYFEGKAETKSTASSYNYKELINSFFMMNPKDQMKIQLLRSENLGDGIWLIERWRNSIRSNIDYYDLTHQDLSIDEVNALLEESSNLFNDYINKARNKQFKNKKWSYEYSKQVLQKIKTDLDNVLNSLKNIDVEDSKINRSIEKAIIQTERFVQRINDEIEYLDKTVQQYN